MMKKILLNSTMYNANIFCLCLITNGAVGPVVGCENTPVSGSALRAIMAAVRNLLQIKWIYVFLCRGSVGEKQALLPLWQRPAEARKLGKVCPVSFACIDGILLA